MMLDRRDVLAAGVAGAALMTIPLSALAQDAVKTADELIAEFTGGADVTDGEGITLTAPEIAENGNTVPVSVSAPGAAEIYMLAMGNPTPAIALVKFGELAGSQSVSTRIRLAKTQDVVAFAKMPDGALKKVSSNVKVTIGGCGG